MKPLVALSLSAVLLSGCVGITPSRDEESLKIASWNMEHLAERDGEGCRPRTETDYFRLRAHAEALGADVIAFQEVQNRAAAERVFDPAIYDVVMSWRPPSTRNGECRGQPGLFIQNQAVGFAIRKGVPWTRNADLSALALGKADLRWGVDVTISRGRPVRLLAVHLKSGCNSGREPTDPDCPVLFDQLPVLERWTETRAREGQAFVVLGDWNRRLASRNDAFLADLNDGDPEGSPLTLPRATARRTARPAIANTSTSSPPAPPRPRASSPGRSRSMYMAEFRRRSILRTTARSRCVC